MIVYDAVCYFLSDIEISRSQKPKNVSQLAEELELLPEEVGYYFTIILHQLIVDGKLNRVYPVKESQGKSVFPLRSGKVGESQGNL